MHIAFKEELTEYVRTNHYMQILHIVQENYSEIEIYLPK